MVANVEKKTPVKMAGYLEKRGKMRMVSRWKRLWFVLKGRLLHYYKSQSEYDNLSPCRGSLNMGIAASVRPGKGLELRVLTRSQSVVLRAANKTDHEQWLQALLDAMALQDFHQTAVPSSSSVKPVQHFRYHPESETSTEEKYKTHRQILFPETRLELFKYLKQNVTLSNDTNHIDINDNDSVMSNESFPHLSESISNNSNKCDFNESKTDETIVLNHCKRSLSTISNTKSKLCTSLSFHSVNTETGSVINRRKLDAERNFHLLSNRLPIVTVSDTAIPIRSSEEQTYLVYNNDDDDDEETIKENKEEKINDKKNYENYSKHKLCSGCSEQDVKSQLHTDIQLKLQAKFNDNILNVNKNIITENLSQSVKTVSEMEKNTDEVSKKIIKYNNDNKDKTLSLDRDLGNLNFNKDTIENFGINKKFHVRDMKMLFEGKTICSNSDSCINKTTINKKNIENNDKSQCLVNNKKEEMPPCKETESELLTPCTDKLNSKKTNDLDNTNNKNISVHNVDKFNNITTPSFLIKNKKFYEIKEIKSDTDLSLTCKQQSIYDKNNEAGGSCNELSKNTVCDNCNDDIIKKKVIFDITNNVCDICNDKQLDNDLNMESLDDYSFNSKKYQNEDTIIKKKRSNSFSKELLFKSFGNTTNKPKLNALFKNNCKINKNLDYSEQNNIFVYCENDCKDEQSNSLGVITTNDERKSSTKKKRSLSFLKKMWKWRENKIKNCEGNEQNSCENNINENKGSCNEENGNVTDTSKNNNKMLQVESSCKSSLPTTSKENNDVLPLPVPEPPPDYDSDASNSDVNKYDRDKTTSYDDTTLVKKDNELAPELPPRNSYRKVSTERAQSPWHDIPKNNKPVNENEITDEEDIPPPLPKKTRRSTSSSNTSSTIVTNPGNYVNFELKENKVQIVASVEVSTTIVSEGAFDCTNDTNPTNMNERYEFNNIFLVQQPEFFECESPNYEPLYDIPRPHASLRASLRKASQPDNKLTPTHFLNANPNFNSHKRCFGSIEFDSLDIDPGLWRNSDDTKYNSFMAPDSLEGSDYNSLSWSNNDSILSAVGTDSVLLNERFLLTNDHTKRPSITSSDNLPRGFISVEEEKMFEDSLNNN